MYRKANGDVKVLLAHPGGPYFVNKDQGVWSIPKGLVEPGEDLLEAAKREFQEETGIKPIGPFIALNPVKLKGGKTVHTWACEAASMPSNFVSNTFKMEWPPKSGKEQVFPEIDKAEFFDLETANVKIHGGQRPLLDELKLILKKGS